MGTGLSPCAPLLTQLSANGPGKQAEDGFISLGHYTFTGDLEEWLAQLLGCGLLVSKLANGINICLRKKNEEVEQPAHELTPIWFPAS